jgi:sugar (pentulose or hexulose) kinase
VSDLLVGIDLGSQSAKVVVYDDRGSVVAEGREPLAPPLSPMPGVVEHPGDDLWDALCVASRRAMGDLGQQRASIVGIGLCGIRFCRALLRADGTLAAPVQSWMDERVSRPYEHQDDDVAWVTASSGYLTHRLTGEHRDSAAAYQGQWPIDTARWQWLEGDRLAAFGIRRDQLAELVQPGELLGTVTATAAAATGLPDGVPVLATANDKAVEALGSGLRDPGDVLVSLGTYIAAMTVGTSDRAGSSYWTNFSSVPGEYLHESAGIRRGMWTVAWVRDLVGQTEEELNDAASLVPVGSHGLLTVLDWLAPTDEPWRRGAFVGLDARHGAAHLHRSVLEGIALTMQRHTAAMAAELGREVRRLVVSGGGAQSELMLQILADAFDRPVTRTRSTSAASLGAAICAAVGVGAHPSFGAATSALVHPDVVVEPRAEGAQRYAELSSVHASLVAAIDPVLRRTDDLPFG